MLTSIVTICGCLIDSTTDDTCVQCAHQDLSTSIERNSATTYRCQKAAEFFSPKSPGVDSCAREAGLPGVVPLLGLFGYQT